MEEEAAGSQFPKRWLAFIVIAALFAGAAAGAVVSLLISNRSSETANSVPSSPSTLERRILASEENAITDVVDHALPSVVTIINDQGTSRDRQGNFVQNISSGSGIIIDDRGFILTNEHVIHNPGKLPVVLNGGEERIATPVSDDAPFNDLAVIRVPPGGLTAT